MVKGNWIKQLCVAMGTAAVLLGMQLGAALAAEDQVVPVVDGHLGRCTADFTVTDEEKNPLYDAKIDVSIHYGFLGLRRMSLQVGTNSDGRARVAGLPDKPGKKFSFRITSGMMSDAVLMNTSDGCNAVFEVNLKEK